MSHFGLFWGDFATEMRRAKWCENSSKWVFMHRYGERHFHGGGKRLDFRLLGGKMTVWYID